MARAPEVSWDVHLFSGANLDTCVKNQWIGSFIFIFSKKSPFRLVNHCPFYPQIRRHRSLFMVDGNVIGNKKNAKLLLRELITRQVEGGCPFSITTKDSVNLSGIADKKDMGRLIKAVRDAAAGAADGKRISDAVKTHLG